MPPSKDVMKAIPIQKRCSLTASGYLEVNWKSYPEGVNLRVNYATNQKYG
jgi:hypothetical protein